MKWNSIILGFYWDVNLPYWNGVNVLLDIKGQLNRDT